MYTEFYRLQALPFQLTPDPSFFFASSVHNSAMAHLTYGLSQGEGFIIITGEIGAGKTTLVGHLLATLDKEHYLALNIVSTQLNADEMLRMVASAFNIPTENVDKATLLRKIEAFLTSLHESDKRALLLVDEAQNLTAGALEELRMLSNFQVGSRTPLQCFLLGQPQFRTTLAMPELEQLRQRVTASYHLGPLSMDETRYYIEHRLHMAGWNRDPEFADEAFQQIFDYTKGVPRLINMLCSRLLLYGFLEELHKIDGVVVERVVTEHAEETRQVMAPEAQKPVATTGAAAAATTGDAPVAVPTDAAPAGTPAGYDEVIKRLGAVEDHVKLHERTMNRVLRVLVQQMEGATDDVPAADEGEGDARPQRRHSRLAARRRRRRGRGRRPFADYQRADS